MVSKRVLDMWKDPETVWGKHKKLETFWGNLASGETVVLIYKDKTHEFVDLPKRTTKKYLTVFEEFEADTQVVAILTSNGSQDAYELYLYPKAKDKTVDYVITHYKKYFKRVIPGSKMRLPG